MSWSGGTYTRTNGTYSGANVWASDEGASIGIESARHDVHDKDLADGINACLAKDGSNAATADLNLGSNKITALANGSARTHAASVGQVQDSATQWGGVATGTGNAIAISCTPSPGSYAAGQTFRFIALSSNSGATTINVNSLGAKPVYKEVNFLAAVDLGAYDILANSICEVTYFTGGGGYFTLQTSKPGAGTFTHNLAPNAGSISGLSSVFACSKNGQVMTVNFSATFLQNTSAANNYQFSLPAAVSSLFTNIFLPCYLAVALVGEAGLITLASSTATVTRYSGTFASGNTHVLGGTFSYMVD